MDKNLPRVPAWLACRSHYRLRGRLHGWSRRWLRSGTPCRLNCRLRCRPSNRLARWLHSRSPRWLTRRRSRRLNGWLSRWSARRLTRRTTCGLPRRLTSRASVRLTGWLRTRFPRWLPSFEIRIKMKVQTAAETVIKKVPEKLAVV